MGWWSDDDRNLIGDGPADRLGEALSGIAKPIPFDALVAAFGQALSSTEKAKKPRRHSMRSDPA